MLEEILKKLGEGELEPEKLSLFFSEYAEGRIPEKDILVFLEKFKDIEEPELIKTFVEAEVKTGIQFEWPENLKPVVDKHSTGGIGDKISLIVVPWIASTGLKVAKLSGRALGHTGGTIDKLESIKGVSTAINSEIFFRLVSQNGCAIAEPHEDICPVESKLYELRDRSGLIPFVPLITASILSKKIATNADILVFDVKTGRGAFLKTYDESRKLAEMLVNVSRLFNKKAAALITSMENPLGYAVGNSLEVLEAISFLEGKDIPGVNEVAYGIAVQAMVLAGFDEEEAFIQLEAARRSGKALSYFVKMVSSLGGPDSIVELKRSVPRAPVVGILTSTQDKGYVHHIDPLKVADAVMKAGKGKRRPDTGVILKVQIGDEAAPEDELCEIHAVDYESLDKAIDVLETAFIIEESKPAPHTYLLERIIQA